MYSSDETQEYINQDPGLSSSKDTLQIETHNAPCWLTNCNFESSVAHFFQNIASILKGDGIFCSRHAKHTLCGNICHKILV